MRGAAFGLRQSLDTVGAFAGPLLAMALMLAWHDDFRAVFWVAVIPAVLSFALILFAVREPAAVAGPREKVRFERALLKRLGPAFWAVTAAGTALTLARFSEAFLILRATDLGLAVALAPLVLVGMNLVYSVTAYPVGRIADRIGPKTLLYAGIVMLIAADVVLALASNMVLLSVGVVLWGLHMGFTQGLLSAMVAQTAPADLRGTAFGAFNLASGIAMLVASALAGALWQFVGPAATFWAGAVLAGISAVLAVSTLKSRRTP
jgi:MFS family permease